MRKTGTPGISLTNTLLKNGAAEVMGHVAGMSKQRMLPVKEGTLENPA